MAPEQARMILHRQGAFASRELSAIDDDLESNE
jgi:hypothetical protein